MRTRPGRRESTFLFSGRGGLGWQGVLFHRSESVVHRPMSLFVHNEALGYSDRPMATDDKAALLIIDAQQEYFAPLGKVVLPGGPPAVKQIARVLAWARERRLPIFHIVHESRRPGAAIFVPGTPALEIHPEA